MHDLAPLTPLGQSAPRVDRHGGVTLREVTDMALASFAARLGREGDAAAVIADVIGAAPPPPGRLGGKGLTAFWTGPDQWMIEAPLATHEDLAAQLAARAQGAASVSEQNDGWCRFDVSGGDLPRVFERLCVVDTRRHTGGEAQRTVIEHLGCFLLCRTPDHYSVLAPRSAATSLHHGLLTALRAAF